MGLSRQYVKLCDLQDFEDPELLRWIRDILPERDPLAHVERKVWEFAMLAAFLDDVGRLGEDTRALGVGAGDERIVFWLANRIGKVVATDIYGTGDFASGEAEASMLTDPGSHAPFPYRSDRLKVRWMDARELDFPADSFDVVFCVSSIEHFGTGAEVSRAAAEIGRVLRPGGHAAIITDCYVRRHPLNLPPLRRRVLADTFTWREIERWIVRGSGLTLMQPFDAQLSPESFANVHRQRRDGSFTPATGAPYPHVILEASRSLFTSVFLALEKPR